MDRHDGANPPAALQRVCLPELPDSIRNVYVFFFHLCISPGAAGCKDNALADSLLRESVRRLDLLAGSESPMLDAPLSMLATLYAHRGSPAQGLPFIDRAIGLTRSCWGPDHPACGRLLRVRADLEIAAWRYDRAGVHICKVHPDRRVKNRLASSQGNSDHPAATAFHPTCPDRGQII